MDFGGIIANVISGTIVLLFWYFLTKITFICNFVTSFCFKNCLSINWHYRFTLNSRQRKFIFNLFSGKFGTVPLTIKHDTVYLSFQDRWDETQLLFLEQEALLSTTQEFENTGQRQDGTKFNQYVYNVVFKPEFYKSFQLKTESFFWRIILQSLFN